MDMTEAQRTRIEGEVEGIVKGLYDALTRADGAPWLTTLHERTGPWLIGTELNDLREASEAYAKAWTVDDTTRLLRQEMDGFTVTARALSPTVVFVVCTSSERRWYFANGTVDRARCAETWVFVHTDDGWRTWAGQLAMLPIEA